MERKLLKSATYGPWIATLCEWNKDGGDENTQYTVLLLDTALGTVDFARKVYGYAEASSIFDSLILDMEDQY